MANLFVKPRREQPILTFNHSRGGAMHEAQNLRLFARHAVHAAMAGKTGLVIGFLHERFIHLPIELLATHTKRLDPASGWWRSVLAATGQAAQFD
jgi:hypothetical protein